MKAPFIIIAIILIQLESSLAKIRNGYEPEIVGIRTSLLRLNSILETDLMLCGFQRTLIRSGIKKLEQYLLYSQLTDSLLTRFRLIAPDIYNEIDNLKSARGVAINIYVRFAPESEMRRGAQGTTNLAHCRDDPGLYTSVYGPASVSIRIASVNRSLQLLAHEFGHARYQVPNIEKYLASYISWYGTEPIEGSNYGHNVNDPSGRSAILYEIAFRARYVDYLKSAPGRLDNPITLLGSIRKSTKSRL